MKASPSNFILFHSLIINKFSSSWEKKDIDITSLNDVIHKILKTGATQAINCSGMETCRMLI